MLISNWILAARPKTLTAAVAPVIIGSTLAYSNCPGLFSYTNSICALICALTIQMGTNYFNDAIDFKRGADTSERLGPTRAAASGLLSYRQLLTGGIFLFFIATLIGVVLVSKSDWPILAIGVSALCFGYLYTGSKYSLAYLGLGEIFVILYFGIIAVAGTAYLSCTIFSFPQLIAGIQIGILAAILIAINNLRDINGDRAACKKTLAVRFGANFARIKIIAFCLLPYILGGYWLNTHPFAALLPLASTHLATRIIIAMRNQTTGRELNVYLLDAAKLHALFGILFCLGFMINVPLF